MLREPSTTTLRFAALSPSPARWISILGRFPTPQLQTGAQIVSFSKQRCFKSKENAHIELDKGYLASRIVTFNGTINKCVASKAVVIKLKP